MSLLVPEKSKSGIGIAATGLSENSVIVMKKRAIWIVIYAGLLACYEGLSGLYYVLNCWLVMKVADGLVE